MAVTLKKPEEIELMRRAGRIVAQTLQLLSEHVKPGVTTRELDDLAYNFIRSQGAIPTFKGYHPYPSIQPFPGSICASVNEEIVHGIPSDRVLKEGDIIGLVGTTGWSTGCHLHFDVILNERYVDPGPYLGLPSSNAPSIPFQATPPVVRDQRGVPVHVEDGDVPIPRGGVRNVIPEKADYISLVREAQPEPYAALWPPAAPGPSPPTMYDPHTGRPWYRAETIHFSRISAPTWPRPCVSTSRSPSCSSGAWRRSTST